MNTYSYARFRRVAVWCLDLPVAVSWDNYFGSETEDQ